MEQWAKLPIQCDYDYYVSSLGAIRKYDKMLRQSNSNGYRVVSLRINGKSVQHKVHRLVALTFIPNPMNLPCINHKDEDKSNNCVNNLEWCTVLYNNTYGSRPNKIRESNSRRGCPQKVRDKIKQSVTKVQGKSVAYVDTFGNVIKTYESTMDAERSTGVPHNVISAICLGKKSHHKGTHWIYVD